MLRTLWLFPKMGNPHTTAKQPKKCLVLLCISTGDLSRCLDSQLMRHSVLDTIGIHALCLTLSYLYSSYCMKNTLGMNQISDLKDLYPSIFVFETFDTGRFFPSIKKIVVPLEMGHMAKQGSQDG